MAEQASAALKGTIWERTRLSLSLFYLPNRPPKNLRFRKPVDAYRAASYFPVAVCLMAVLPAPAQDLLTPVVAAPLVSSTLAVLVHELVIPNTGTATATLQTIEVVGPVLRQKCSARLRATLFSLSACFQ